MTISRNLTGNTAAASSQTKQQVSATDVYADLISSIFSLVADKKVLNS